MANKQKNFFGRIIESFKDSLIDERLEADLYRHEGNNPSGKLGEIEYFTHTQGHTSIKITIDSKSDLQIKDHLSLHINNIHFKDLKIMDKKLFYKFNSKNGDDIPLIRDGDMIEIQHDHKVILQGKFKKD